MKRVFISMPMADKTEAEIKNERATIIERITRFLQSESGEELYIIDSYIDIPESELEGKNTGLMYLGKSIELLAGADIAVFAPGYENARGCVCEFTAAEKYGIRVIKL